MESVLKLFAKIYILPTVILTNLAIHQSVTLFCSKRLADDHPLFWCSSERVDFKQQPLVKKDPDFIHQNRPKLLELARHGKPHTVISVEIIT